MRPAIPEIGGRGWFSADDGPCRRGSGPRPNRAFIIADRDRDRCPPPPVCGPRHVPRCGGGYTRVGFGFFGSGRYAAPCNGPVAVPVPVIHETVVVQQPPVVVTPPTIPYGTVGAVPVGSTDVPTDGGGYTDGLYGTTLPGQSGVAGPTLAEQLYQFMEQGTEAFGRGDYHEAARLFLQVTLADPQNVDGSLAYAVARFATGDYDLAAVAIRRGVSRYCQVAESSFDLRQRYGRAEDFETHYRALVAAVEADPQNADRLLVLGFVLHFCGQREAAREVFARVAELSPEDAAVVACFLNVTPPAGQTQAP